MPPPAQRYPGFGIAALILVLMVALSTALSTLFYLLGLIVGGLHVNTSSPGFIGIVNISTFLVTFCILLPVFRQSLSEVFALRPFPLPILTPITLATIGVNLLNSELDNLIQHIIPAPQYFMDLFKGLYAQNLTSFLVLVVMAPVTEEPLFRGFIQQGLLKRKRAGQSIVLSALLFALYHIIPWQIPAAFTLGLLLGWIYAMTKSLWPCLYSHALANLVGFVVSRDFFPEIPGLKSQANQLSFQPLWLDLSALALALAGIYWLARVYGKGPKPPPFFPTAESQDAGPGFDVV